MTEDPMTKAQLERNLAENQQTLEVVREVREAVTVVEVGWLVLVAQEKPLTPHPGFDPYRPKVKAWVESQGLDFVLKLLQLEDPYPELWHPRVDRDRVRAELDAMRPPEGERAAVESHQVSEEMAAMRENAQRVGRLLLGSAEPDPEMLAAFEKAGADARAGKPTRVRLLADFTDDQVERLDQQLAQLRLLLEDLRTSYPKPAPYTTESIVIERLTAILGDEPAQPNPITAPPYPRNQDSIRARALRGEIGGGQPAPESGFLDAGDTPIPENRRIPYNQW